MVSPIITQGFVNSTLIPTLGYGGISIAIPGFLKRRKPVQVYFDIDYLFNIYAQIKEEFYQELDLISYPTFSFEYNKRFVIPINKEIKRDILIKNSIKRDIYQEININTERGYRKTSISTILRILNEL